MFKRLFPFFLGIYFHFAGFCHAAIIYSNYDFGDAYNVGVGLLLNQGRPQCGGCLQESINIDVANAFTPSGTDFILERVELTVGLLAGPNQIDLFITTSGPDNKPLSIVETFHIEGAMSPYTDAFRPPLMAISSLHPILNSGTQYWLLAALTGPDAAAGWFFESMNKGGFQAVRCEGDSEALEGCAPQARGDWFVVNQPIRNAFRITGTPIPEPGTLLLLILGLGSLTAWKCRG